MKKVTVGRLAMRAEGDFWNAYFAQQGTMEGAILLGSIRMAAIVDAHHLARKDAFMAMMRSIVSDAIEDVAGVAPTWPGPEPVPEHERSGSA